MKRTEEDILKMKSNECYLSVRNLGRLIDWAKAIERSDLVWTKEDAKLVLRIELESKRQYKFSYKKHYIPKGQ